MPKRILVLIIATISACAVLELVGWLLTPTPPSIDTPDGRTKLFNEKFYVEDPDLIMRLRPHLRWNFDALRPGSNIPVEINSEGFRGEEFEAPDLDAYRILILGDSVTFGLNLAQADAWPSVMRDHLIADAAPRHVQVRNLAVPGYSTFQGRQLFERHALHGDFRPHLVIFGFGFNDGFLRPYTDRDAQVIFRERRSGWIGRATKLLQHSHLLSLLLEPPEEACTHVRVPPAELEENFTAVAAGCKQIGAEVILADTALPYGYARAIVDRVAQRHGAAVLHFRDVLGAAKGTAPPGQWPQDGRVRIEVETHRAEIPPSPDERPDFYALVLADPEARNGGRHLALNDRGVDGDRAAGDGVWSCLTPLWSAGVTPEVAFNIPGSGKQPALRDADTLMLNSFHFIDVTWAPPTGEDPGTQRVAVPNRPAWHDLLLWPDPIHPNEAGARVLGEAVAAAVRELRSFRSF